MTLAPTTTAPGLSVIVPLSCDCVCASDSSGTNSVQRREILIELTSKVDYRVDSHFGDGEFGGSAGFVVVGQSGVVRTKYCRRGFRILAAQPDSHTYYFAIAVIDQVQAGGTLVSSQRGYDNVGAVKTPQPLLVA